MTISENEITAAPPTNQTIKVKAGHVVGVIPLALHDGVYIVGQCIAVPPISVPTSQPVRASIMHGLRAAIDAINEAKKRNDLMQSHHVIGNTEWNAHETIDDHLHDALTALGD